MREKGKRIVECAEVSRDSSVCRNEVEPGQDWGQGRVLFIVCPQCTVLVLGST